jgi:hypothetical protein
MKSHLISFYVFSAAVTIIAFLIDITGPIGNFIMKPGVIGDKTNLLEIILFAAILVSMNFGLSLFLSGRERFLAYVLTVASSAISILALIIVASKLYFW